VEPRPTIEDAAAITRLDPEGRSSLQFEVASGTNEFDLDLTAD
jgi:hypothetical protein